MDTFLTKLVLQMRKHSYFIIIASFLVSCNSDAVTELYPINDSYSDNSLFISDTISDISIQDAAQTINVPTEKEEIDLQDLCSDVHYVPLETRAECLLGSIDVIKADDGLFFVLDKRNSILCSFREDGSFYRKYGVESYSPGEYIYITDFSLDLKNHVLYLLDSHGGKVLCYSYDGQYLSEQPLFYYYDQFECSEPYWILSSSFAHNTMSSQLDLHRIILSDASQKPYSRAFPYPERLRDSFHQESSVVFQKTSDNHVYYNYIPSNVIYELSDSTCTARYRIATQEPGQNWDYLEEQLTTDDIYDSFTEKNRFFPSLYLMNRNFVTCYIFHPNHRVSMLLFDRQSGKQKYGKFHYGDRNSLTDKLFASHFNFATKDNTFINVIQPFDVFKMVDEHERFNIPLVIEQKEQELLSKINEESNPVLMIMNLKSF